MLHIKVVSLCFVLSVLWEMGYSERMGSCFFPYPFKNSNLEGNLGYALLLLSMFLALKFIPVH